MRWPAEKKQYIYIYSKKGKEIYLGPKQHILTRHLGPRNYGGEVGEVWEVRRRHHVPVASQNRAKKTKALKY